MTTKRTTKLPRGYVLVLRTVAANGVSHGGFQWPKRGSVECPDWDATPSCGNGLHGLLWGEGDGSLLNWSDDAVWQVVTVKSKDIVDLGGKVKFPSGTVWSGGRDAAVKKILAEKPDANCVGSTVSGGDRSTVSGGYRSTVSGGYGSTVSGGDGSTVSGGYGSTVSGGDGSTVSGGDRSTVSGGDGSFGVARYGQKAKAGTNGAICISYSDGNRERFAIGYVGENGIKPDTWYCVKNGTLAEVVE